MIRCGVLTVSDRCSAGGAEDKSGPALIKLLEGQKKHQYTIEQATVIPDEKSQIEAVLKHWSDDLHLDLVLTTGGTGFAPRDVTPEATKSVLDSEAPGIVIAMMTASLSITPMAMLSRSVAGVRGQTLIVNLPGSPKGASENAETALRAIPHAVALLKGDIKNVEKVHQKLHCGCSHEPEHVGDITKVAHRPRKSPYPMISVNAALKIIYTEVESLQKAYKMPIHLALGCIAAEDAVSLCNIPPYAASVKDGYAVLSADGAGERQVVGDVLAGGNLQMKLFQPGECLRITTGAAVCGGADAVVQVEDTELLLSTPDGREELKINIIDAPQKGQDIRPVGSDLAIGQVVVERGNEIGPAQVGALASAGVKTILTYKRPKIAVLSTGNEIQDISSPSPGPFVIYDSNRPTLIALLTQQGFQVEDLGIAKDDPDAIAETLKKGFASADVVVSSGGVSMGEKDFLKHILITKFLAKIHFGRVNMKPGKPTTFATCDFKGQKKLVFALPGNPVSATVTCHLFALPALRVMAGFSSGYSREITVQLAETITLDSRPEYCRAVLERAPVPTKSVPVAHLTGNQMSSRLLSLQSGSVLIELPGGTKEKGTLQRGELVKALLI
ncbi:gephyrin [Cloeon dipterum]|uniref:gephyrin n=1 Tax=Cloeon dipterum TaxID=197152 RepID=UPI00321FCEB1